MVGLLVVFLGFPCAEARGRAGSLLRVFRIAKTSPFAREILFSPRGSRFRKYCKTLTFSPKRSFFEPWHQSPLMNGSEPFTLTGVVRARIPWEESLLKLNSYELGELFVVLAYTDDVGRSLRAGEVLSSERTFRRSDSFWMNYLSERARFSEWQHSDFEIFGDLAGQRFFRFKATMESGLTFQDAGVPTGFNSSVMNRKAEALGFENAAIPKEWNRLVTGQGQGVVLERDVDTFLGNFSWAKTQSFLRDLSVAKENRTGSHPGGGTR